MKHKKLYNDTEKLHNEQNELKIKKHRYRN